MIFTTEDDDDADDEGKNSKWTVMLFALPVTHSSGGRRCV